MKSFIIMLLLVFGCYLPLQAHQHREPQVVVSIKPIHSLTAALMQGIAEPQLIIKDAGSPHGYSLRPSEARMLANADLVIWVGDGLETFLPRSLANLGKQEQQLALMDHLRSAMLPIREGGDWEGDGHDAHGHHDDHGAKDPHIWTSPLVAKEIVRLIADRLATVDPSHADIYAANATRVTAQLDQLYLELKAQLQPVVTVPYLVFHDAYQYFERDFAVNAIGSVTIDAERAPGVRRVMEVRDKISELKARAVFSEPQFQSRIVATIIEGTGVKTGILDPMGASLPAGSEAYFLLIKQLADELVRVLR